MQNVQIRERLHSPSPLYLRAVVIGAAAALVTVILVSGILAVVVYWTAITELQLNQLLYYSGMLATTLGGLLAARAANQRGWLHGGVAGLIYVLVGATLGHLLFPHQPTPLAQLGPRMVLGFLLGALGGVLGMLL